VRLAKQTVGVDVRTEEIEVDDTERRRAERCDFARSVTSGTPSQAGDNPHLLPLPDQVAVGRDGPRRPRKRPDRVLADKAYSHPSTRTALRQRGIAFTCPEKSDQFARRRAKGSRGSRPPAFHPDLYDLYDLYADRNVVERCFKRLKQFRGLATRYAKRAAYYRAETILACGCPKISAWWLTCCFVSRRPPGMIRWWC
jgi:transposase